MSTYMPKAGDITRTWYILDAEGQSLGRVAAKAAHILRGKHKPTYAPHADCGDHVIIINAEKAVLTGNKLTQKYYYRHTGYIGHLRAVRYDTLMAEKPETAHLLTQKTYMTAWQPPKRMLRRWTENIVKIIREALQIKSNSFN